MIEKTCTKCGKIKPLDDFKKDRQSSTGYASYCKECNRVYLRDFRQRRKLSGLCRDCGNPHDTGGILCAECKKSHRRHKLTHLSSEKGKETERRYGAQRRKKESYKKWRRDYMRERYANDIQFKLSRLITDRISKVVRGKYKYERISKYIGCPIEQLMAHIEQQFDDGMSWGNHGEWHIDHIIPLAAVDLTDEKQLATVCHYTNLQPLWASDNIRKGANLPQEGSGQWA